MCFSAELAGPLCPGLRLPAALSSKPQKPNTAETEGKRGQGEKASKDHVPVGNLWASGSLGVTVLGALAIKMEDRMCPQLLALHLRNQQFYQRDCSNLTGAS